MNTVSMHHYLCHVTCSVLTRFDVSSSVTKSDVFPRMSPLSIVLLFGSLTCFGSFATASGGFECSVKHMCDYVTKKCKHVTICEQYDDDEWDRVAAVRVSMYVPSSMMQRLIQ